MEQSATCNLFFAPSSQHIFIILYDSLHDVQRSKS